uniref:DM2 domain-containing protein n=1 Tax=viral metagenome TaxID=1070528 RepID=A0A6C0L243_9ZZZZ|tara:strand:+ start:2268 stop:2861 length:594 start_codon:yes stop_codon:yes gene_type:complete
MPGKKTSVKATKAKKSSTSKKVEKPVEVETKVVEPTPVQEPVEDESYDAEFTELRDQLRSAGEIIKSLVGQVNRLEKRVSRDRKVMQKKMKGRAKRVVDPNKPPSGFAKPGPISDELRAFLKLPKDELIARTEVTKKITEYCKANNLQKQEDKRTIQVDSALKKLLRLKKGDELTFFNLQKYMKVHYPNKDGVFVHA